ncbi:hypothetical protein TNCV_3418231 [Trichonephila clavipes]|nr:hypothetical protein TNCV_3418231 [Trichonephila clavipes]
MEKQPSLGIVQTIKQKLATFFSRKRVCSGSTFCKSQTTKDRNKSPSTGPNRDYFRLSCLRHERRSCKNLNNQPLKALKFRSGFENLTSVL